MVENYLLQQLCAVVEYGTLSETAKHLNVSQSALSRSMQRLEQAVGVPLFERKRNFVAPNDNCRIFAKSAAEILAQIENAVEKVRDFERKKHTISLGACAPIPLNEIFFLLNQHFSGVSISAELNNDEYLLQGLNDDYFNLIVLHEKPDDKFFYVECEREKLFLAVPLNHKFADKDGIFLEELNGEKILLYSKIGFWYDLCREKAPAAKFLMQNERDVFQELTATAALLSFTTDIFLKNGRTNKNCVYKPILDADADVTYYCVCKSEQKARFKNLFESLAKKNFSQDKIIFFV